MNQSRERVRQFLASHTTLTLATVAEDGQPQAASLFFAEMEDLSLIFISERKTRHGQNIQRDSRVAATIYADGQAWQSIQGVQLEGHCQALSGQAAKTARTVYLAKYPFIAKNKILAAMLNLVIFYRIEPAWIRLIDNSRGFGHKEELHLQLSTS
jgi:uncharacterized protein YhbP (UPF0306 family)